jgi:hypothetical protein
LDGWYRHGARMQWGRLVADRQRESDREHLTKRLPVPFTAAAAVWEGGRV